MVPQDKPMNVKIGYDDDNDLTNFSKFFVMITIWPLCLNSQSSHTISIPTSISSISTDCVKGPIEEDILLVNNEIISDCIGERIVSYKGANNNILSNLKLTSMLSLDFTSTWVALLILYSVYTWSRTSYKFYNYFGFKHWETLRMPMLILWSILKHLARNKIAQVFPNGLMSNMIHSFA